MDPAEPGVEVPLLAVVVFVSDIAACPRFQLQEVMNLHEADSLLSPAYIVAPRVGATVIVTIELTRVNCNGADAKNLK